MVKHLDGLWLIFLNQYLFGRTDKQAINQEAVFQSCTGERISCMLSYSVLKISSQVEKPSCSPAKGAVERSIKHLLVLDCLGTSNSLNQQLSVPLTGIQDGFLIHYI